jgi:hypothetical protein
VTPVAKASLSSFSIPPKKTTKKSPYFSFSFHLLMYLKTELVKYKLLDTFYNNLSNIIDNYKDVINNIRYSYKHITKIPELHEQEHCLIINKLKDENILSFNNKKTNNHEYLLNSYITENIDMLCQLSISNISKVLNRQFKIIKFSDNIFPITELFFQDINNLLLSTCSCNNNTNTCIGGIVIDQDDQDIEILFYKLCNKVYYTDSGKDFINQCIELNKKDINSEIEINKYFTDFNNALLCPLYL